MDQRFYCANFIVDCNIYLRIRCRFKPTAILPSQRLACVVESGFCAVGGCAYAVNYQPGIPFKGASVARMGR